MPLDSIPHLFINTPQWSVVSSTFDGNHWLRSARGKLAELEALPEGWNSYGSRSIQREVIVMTSQLLSDLVKIGMPEPAMFPVSGGGIQLEWENSTCELEIEVMPDENVEYLVVDQSGEMHEGQLPRYGSLLDLVPLTDWFVKEKSSIVDLANFYVPSFR